MVREVDRNEEPVLYHVVEDMAMVAQIPMPRVYVIDDQGLNAFATGSDVSKCCCSSDIRDF